MSCGTAAVSVASHHASSSRLLMAYKTYCEKDFIMRKIVKRIVECEMS